MVGIQVIALSALALLPSALANPVDLLPRGIIGGTNPIPCNATYVKAANPPPTRNCNVQGTIAAPAQIGAQSKPGSEDGCLARGKTTMGAISYSYNPTSGVCKIYSKRIIDMTFRKSQSGTAYTNLKCFKNQCQCLDEDHPDLCGNMCTNTDDDANNCGGCGNPCDGPCFMGSCGFNCRRGVIGCDDA